jgi:hypothetical protein
MLSLVNVIALQKPIYYILLYKNNRLLLSFGYVITFSLAQSDHIKRLQLYKPFFPAWFEATFLLSFVLLRSAKKYSRIIY